MTIPGNPHALIKNGVCTTVIAMQNYDADTIKKTLAPYDYDKVINCSELGYEISCGQEYYEEYEVWAHPTIYKTWIIDKKTRNWIPPIPYPQDGQAYTWSEDKQEWINCASNDFNTEKDEEPTTFVDIIDLNENIDLISISTENHTNNRVSAMEDKNAN